MNNDARMKELEDEIKYLKKQADERGSSSGLFSLTFAAFLMVDKAKEKDLRQTAELTLHLKGKELFAQAHHEDLYHAMDAVIDKLDRQLLKHKEIIQDHHHDKNKVQSLSQ